jgi:Fe-S oxidoreductase
MAGCAHDFIYPDQLVAAFKIIESKPFSVSFPRQQSCCGLPLQMLGERKASLQATLGNLAAFDKGNPKYIVTLCPSCANHMKNHYPEIVKDGAPDKLELALRVSAKVWDFSSFALNVLKLSVADFNNTGQKAAYHAPCHLVRGLKVTKEPRELINLAGQYQETPEEEVCCGFGGSYSLKFPEVSEALMTSRLEALEKEQASLLVTDCPGCVLQLRGGVTRQKRPIQVEHISEFLLRALKPKSLEDF